MINIEFNERQKKIVDIVKEFQPITSEHIANKLNVSRSTLRSDLSILTMSGILEARPKVGYFYTEESDETMIYKKIEKIKVGDVKSLPVVVDEKVTVYDAIVTMFLEDIGSLYIVSEGYLAGVVSRKDLLKTAIGGNDIKSIPLSIIMTRMPNIIMTYTQENVFEAAKKIIIHQIDSLPVVEKHVKDGQEKYKVLGRLSKSNITKLFVEMVKEK
ncbi:MAG: helix-turn-helix transcriptional regulator [Firmicutes bacterium]|nr:helix-turn-helix transcriptional regulator [Bacillota bacterium]